MKRGEIYLIDIQNRQDHVQDGKRLCVVVQNDVGNEHSPTTIVVPLTSKLKRLDLRTHVVLENNYLRCPSMALCEQIFTVSKDNLIHKICELNEHEMRKISVALMCSVGII